MPFVNGCELSECFFYEVAEEILTKNYPQLWYSAGLIGYGSDVIGFDDTVSTDHMWGPRFYLFLKNEDYYLKNEILNTLNKNFPYEFCGYSVNFSEPDKNDGGVRHAQNITDGIVSSIVFVYTFDEYLNEYLGECNFDNVSYLDWLSFSEHKLLSLVSGKIFRDNLNIKNQLEKIKYYPDNIKHYLIASQWSLISEEQAFVKRAGSRDDEVGSRIICARIAERLMRLCFIYCETYAPYSKWFGSAFERLDVPHEIKKEIRYALEANKLDEREEHIVMAQYFVGNLHNFIMKSTVENKIQHYFGRDIKVIYAHKFSEDMCIRLQDTELALLPLVGTLCQVGNFVNIADNTKARNNIKNLYKP